MTADEIWDQGAAALRAQLAPATWAAWFHGVRPVEFANDVLMLQTAGLGIAFRAKPMLREAADMSLNHERLDALLVLMGYNAGGLHALDERADVRPGDGPLGGRHRRRSPMTS